MKTTIHISSVLALMLLQTSCGKEKTEQKTEVLAKDSVPVKVTKVDKSERSEPIRVAGTVASSEEARLAFKVGGVINKVYVKEGQTVRKGQLLATLDLTEIDAQVNQAQFSADKSERDMKRIQNMVRDTAATLEQLQNATTGHEVAQQNLKIAKFNQSYAKIISPIAGTVTQKMINEGELIGANNPAFLLASNHKNDWVVRVGVSDKDWARIKMGDKASVSLDAYPNEPFSGTISNLAQSADPASKLYEIEVKINPAGKRFANGLYAKVNLIPSQSRNYAVIPVEAVIEGNGENAFVFINNHGKAKRIPIKIGYLDGENVLITNGLEDISEVVTAGSAYLTEGASLLIKRSDDAELENHF